MTDHRLPAAWLRTFAGFVALVGLLVLGGCGGGSGAPNPTFNPITSLALSPSAATVYSNTPVTLTVQGGRKPYSAFSSDQSAVPTPVSFNGNAFTVTPNAVLQDTRVVMTVRDADGNSSQSELTLRPAPLVASLTLKADGFSDVSCPNPGGSASSVDTLPTTFICSGQTGSVGVRLQNTVGGGISGRQIRFDVVQGDFQIFTNGPGQPPTYGLSYTVPSDQNGEAIARVRALPNANQQVVIVQATDLLTGTFVRGIFIIINGAGQEVTVIPDTVNITGPDSEHCSAGVTASFFIFGGLPPYTIRNTAPQYLAVTPTVVTESGGGFNATTLGGCLDPGRIIITDSAGHSETVEITNELGSAAPASNTSTIDISLSPSTIPTLTCGAPQNIVVTGGGTVTTQGSTVTVTPAESYFISVSRPDLITIANPNPSPGQAFTLTRASGAPAPVTLNVSDGIQVVTRDLTLSGTCP